MCGSLDRADGDCQGIVGIVAGEFFGSKFGGYQAVEKRGGGEYVAKAFDRDVFRTEGIGKETLRGGTSEAPELSAFSHHGGRRHLADAGESYKSDTSGSQNAEDGLDGGVHIVYAHKNLSADYAVKCVGEDRGSIGEVGQKGNTRTMDNVEDICPGDPVVAKACHILVFADFDAAAADVLCVTGEKLLDVNSINALTAEPSECAAVGLEAAKFGEVSETVERQQSTLCFQLLEA